jgi:hypothetical protein
MEKFVKSTQFSKIDHCPLLEWTPVEYRNRASYSLKQVVVPSYFRIISGTYYSPLISIRGFISIIWYKTCLIILGFVNVILLVIWNKLNSYKYCYLRNQWEMQQIWHVDLLVGWVISTTNDSKICILNWKLKKIDCSPVEHRHMTALLHVNRKRIKILLCGI